MNKSKGFTIIELIVVIAIIAVLAAIVLVNVTQYINKSKNSAIEGNMATLLTNAAQYFDNNPGSFGTTFVANTTTGCGAGGAIATAITNAGGSIACYGDDDTQTWCGSSATLAAGSTAASTFCVDSTGYKGVKGATGCSATVFACP